MASTEQWWGNSTTSWGNWGGICPHGISMSAGVQCYQCANPHIYSPSSPLYPPPPPVMFGGWKCPGCGRCWGPQVTQCLPCAPVVNATGGNADPVSDLCLPSGDGSLCSCESPDEDDNGTCRGGRHCSC